MIRRARWPARRLQLFGGADCCGALSLPGHLVPAGGLGCQALAADAGEARLGEREREQGLRRSLYFERFSKPAEVGSTRKAALRRRRPHA